MTCDHGHHLCRGCLQGTLIFNLEPRRLATFGGAIPCPEAGCDASPWIIETDLKDHLDVATAIKYGVAMRYQAFDAAAAKRKAAEEFVAREAAAQEAGLAMDEKLQRLRLAIIEQHFYLRCPRCAFKFVDFAGCNAVDCGKCGAGFCSICLEDCGVDAHTHYGRVHGGDIFDKAKFVQAKKERVEAALVAAVEALRSEGAPLQTRLVHELAKADLPDLGIKAADILTRAGVREEAISAAEESWICGRCRAESPLSRTSCADCHLEVVQVSCVQGNRYQFEHDKPRPDDVFFREGSALSFKLGISPSESVRGVSRMVALEFIRLSQVDRYVQLRQLEDFRGVVFRLDHEETIDYYGRPLHIQAMEELKSDRQFLSYSFVEPSITIHFQADIWALSATLRARSGGPTYQVFLKTFTGKTLAVDVESDDTIEKFKFLVWSVEGIVPSEQRLIFAGK